MAFTTRNNATSLLAGSLAAGDTVLSVTPGEGAKFPNPSAGDWFPLTLAKANGSLEIVRATARSGDVITITRAQEGTAAQAFSAGDRVELRMTSAVFTELQTKTSDAQTTASSAQADATTANTAIANTVVRRDSATGAAILPGGTTAQRPAVPAAGMVRWNSEIGDYESYYGSAWVPRYGANKAFNEASIVTLASAATVDIGAASANTISITGTTSITSLGTFASGAKRTLIFQGSLTLTHNSTSLILLGGANIKTNAGDIAEFVSLGSGNWRCVSYIRSSGASVSGPFTNEYVSPQQSFAAGGLITLSHGLTDQAGNATMPKVINFEYVCITASDGYSVGDVIELGGGNYTNNAVGELFGFFPTKTNTTLSIRVGSNGGAVIGNKATGSVVSSINTAANFRLVVRAFA